MIATGTQKKCLRPLELHAILFLTPVRYWGERTATSGSPLATRLPNGSTPLGTLTVDYSKRDPPLRHRILMQRGTDISKYHKP